MNQIKFSNLYGNRQQKFNLTEKSKMTTPKSEASNNSKYRPRIQFNNSLNLQR